MRLPGALCRICGLLIVAQVVCSSSSKFTAYKRQFNKAYASAALEAAAEAAFNANDAIIASHNPSSSYELGHNQFSDLTLDEFRQRYLMAPNPHANRTRMFVPQQEEDFDPPASIDWVKSGATTPVKNQGQCSSCWAFSATGAIEGALKIAGHSLLSLSEQQLVSCDKSDHACDGGLADRAFTFAEKNPLCSEAAYPYTSSGGGTPADCKTSCKGAVRVGGFVDVDAYQKGDPELCSALAKRPLAVAIDAATSAFQLYKSGVLDDKAACQDSCSLDHGVLAVGYGLDAQSNKSYYRVKNSWGKAWGEQGYVRLVQGHNQCGINQQVSYPTGVAPAAAVEAGGNATAWP